MRGPRIEVELEFNKATAAWVKDRAACHAGTKRMRGGGLRMTLPLPIPVS